MTSDETEIGELRERFAALSEAFAKCDDRRSALLSACEAQEKSSSHAFDCTACDIGDPCEEAASLKRTAADLRIVALIKAYGP